MDVVGDSMEPTICNGDTLLVDKSDTELKDGHIYVVTLFDELRVKRIAKALKFISLISDNKKYPDVPVYASDMDQMKVHGRVRWSGRIF
jgi:phage repressor protein C with HTH and peptisase S24 domain